MLLVESAKCQGSGDSVPGRGVLCDHRSTQKPDEPFFYLNDGSHHAACVMQVLSLHAGFSLVSPSSRLYNNRWFSEVKS